VVRGHNLPSMGRTGWAIRTLELGVSALVLGGLTYVASRGLGGVWPGILVSGVFSWLGFQLVLSFVRGVEGLETRVKPRHAILAGCLSLVAACGALGLLFSFGQQLVIGVIIAGVAVVGTRMTRTQLGGLEPTLPQALRPAAVVVGVLFLLVGVAFGGSGAFRIMEAGTYAIDAGCEHPCAMVKGLWVRVLPNSDGDFVARLDPVSVVVRLRFWDEVAGDRVASPLVFTVSNPPAVYQNVTDRPGCEPWGSRVLHNGDVTQDLSLCFAVPQSQEADLAQLVLEWAQADVTASIGLGKKSSWGVGIDFSTG